MKKYAGLNIIGQAVKVVVSFILITLGFSFLGPLVGFLFSYVTMMILYLPIAPLKIVKKVKINTKLVWKYAIPAFIVMILSQIFTNTQFVILSSFTTQEITGLFAVAFKISTFVVVIPNILNNALFPITSQLSAVKDSKKQQEKMINTVLRYTLYLTIPIILLLAFFSKYAIILFANKSYVSATFYLPYLLLASLFLGIGNIFLNNLYAIKRPTDYRNVYLITVLLYLPLAILLTLNFNGFGLAIAYLASTVMFFFIGFIKIRKYLSIRISKSELLKILIASSLSLAFLILTKPFIHDFIIAIPFMTASVSIYLFALLKLRFYTKEDLEVVDFFLSKTPERMKFMKNFLKVLRNYLVKHIR